MASGGYRYVWTGYILRYEVTDDGRQIPSNHRILFPLKVPVYIPPATRTARAHEHFMVGEAFNFIEDMTMYGVLATIGLSREFPGAMAGEKLYPEIDLADIDIHEDHDKIVIFGGRLQAIALGQRPAWKYMTPVINGSLDV